MDDQAEPLALDQLAKVRAYRALNGGAHRKPPPIVGSPAVVRHIGFWIPPDPLAEGGGDKPRTSGRERREQWLAHIDWFLAELAHRLFFFDAKAKTYTEGENNRRASSFNLSRRVANRTDLNLFRHKVVDFRHDKPLAYVQLQNQDIDRYETVSFHFLYHGVPAKIRAELHTEYFTLSCFLEFDEPQTPATGHEQFVSAFTALSHHFRRATEQSLKQTRAPYSRVKSHSDFRTQIQSILLPSEYIYEKLWREFQQEIIEPALNHPACDGPPLGGANPARTAMCAGQSLNGRVGAIFADFRGLLASARNPDEVLPPAEDDALPPSAAPTNAIELIQPYVPHARRSLEDYVGRRKFSCSEEHAIVEAAMPILGAAELAGKELIEANATGQNGVKPEYSPRIEYTASSVLDHRAVYLSCLGPQRPWRDTNEPVRFMIIATHRHRWQLGRLLDRFHTTGALRLASLIDLQALQQSGFDIRDLNYELAQIEDTIAKQPAASSAEPNKRTEMLEKQVTHLKEIQDRIGELSSMCDGGVEHRTSRSYLYVTNFRRICEAQRIKQIEGFQNYSEFVERRLGATWSYIHSLPRRFEQLRSHLSSVHFSIQTSEQIRQTDEQIRQTEQQIAQTKAQQRQVEAQLEQTREQANQTREQAIQTQEQVRLSRFAELVAVFPVAYYLGHVIDTGVHASGFAEQLALWLNPQAPDHSQADQTVAFGSYLAAGAIYLLILMTKETWKRLGRLLTGK